MLLKCRGRRKQTGVAKCKEVAVGVKLQKSKLGPLKTIRGKQHKSIWLAGDEQNRGLRNRNWPRLLNGKCSCDQCMNICQLLPETLAWKISIPAVAQCWFLSMSEPQKANQPTSSKYTCTNSVARPSFLSTVVWLSWICLCPRNSRPTLLSSVEVLKCTALQPGLTWKLMWVQCYYYY